MDSFTVRGRDHRVELGTDAASGTVTNVRVEFPHSPLGPVCFSVVWRPGMYTSPREWAVHPLRHFRAVECALWRTDQEEEEEKGAFICEGDTPELFEQLKALPGMPAAIVQCLSADQVAGYIPVEDVQAFLDILSEEPAPALGCDYHAPGFEALCGDCARMDTP